MGQGDVMGLHSAHGQSSHGAVPLIGDGAEVGVNIRNQVVNENVIESSVAAEAAKAKAAASTATAASAASASRAVRSAESAKAATTAAEQLTIGRSIAGAVWHIIQPGFLIIGDR